MPEKLDESTKRAIGAVADQSLKLIGITRLVTDWKAGRKSPEAALNEIATVIGFSRKDLPNPSQPATTDIG